MFCFLLFGQGLCKTDLQRRCEKDRTWCVVGCCVVRGCDVGMEVILPARNSYNFIHVCVRTCVHVLQYVMQYAAAVVYILHIHVSCMYRVVVRVN